MPEVPNRANHPNRKMGDHTTPTGKFFSVSHNEPVTTIKPNASGQYKSSVHTEPREQHFDDKKQADAYAKKVSDQGHETFTMKHDSGDMSGGKPAHLTNLKHGIRRFIKGVN